MRHGHGVFIDAEKGSLYDGQWMFDKLNGRARMIKTDGTIYEGDWVSSAKTGQGKMTLSNGTIFEG